MIEHGRELGEERDREFRNISRKHRELLEDIPERFTPSKSTAEHLPCLRLPPHPRDIGTLVIVRRT